MTLDTKVQMRKWLKKHQLPIFKYIKLISKWCFLTFMHNNKSLWTTGNYPSHIKARKCTLCTCLCCLNKHSTNIRDQSARSNEKISLISPLQSAFKLQAHSFFLFVAVKKVRLGLVSILCQLGHQGWLR